LRLESGKHAPYGNPAFSGQVDGSAQGYHLEGLCKIVIILTLQEGYITGVDFTGSEGNTPGYGKRVIDGSPAQIIERNSFEIDAFSGATTSRNLVIQAGNGALSKIP
jgi:uncharacterized protein with FMN-binding domain